jgi:hypothetical protein
MIDRRIYKRTSMFVVFRQLVETELKDLEDYIDEISHDLIEKQQTLTNNYEKANKEVVESEDFDVHSFFENDIDKYFRVFPIYSYNPLLLTIYGQFENWLKRLCELDRSKGLSKIQVTDLAGNNLIEKSRRYLELVAELTLDEKDSTWLRITEIQKIRNLIAHNNASIKKNGRNIKNHELYKILSEDKRITFNEQHGDFYIRDKELLIEVIQLVKKYLFAVIDKLRLRKVVAKNDTLPYDNQAWGVEKTEGLLKSVIAGLKLLDASAARTDEFKEGDLQHNMRGTLRTMAYDLTKLFAFFTSGEWSVRDVDLIVNDKENGLSEVKKIYN